MINMDRMNNLLKMVSLNVKGLRGVNKRRAIVEWSKQKGDIIFFQETFSTIDIENPWDREWNGKCFFSHGSNHSRGVCILITEKLNLTVLRSEIDLEGRYILLEIEIQGKRLILCNVYFPTRDKQQEQLYFLNLVSGHLNDFNLNKAPIIAGGDFNMIRNFDLDISSKRSNRGHHFNLEFEEFLGKFDMSDIWRKRNSDKIQFTYRQSNPLIQSRLDYWITSNELDKKVVECDIMPSIAPDHSAIYLVLNVDNKVFQNRGPSYWKFNNSLCLDVEYVQHMKTEIISFIDQGKKEITDKRVLWDFVKIKIGEYTSKYSRVKAKERKDRLNQIQKEIQRLENLLISFQDNSILEDLKVKKGELKVLHNQKIEGLKVRSRAKWFEENEINESYFKQLLASNKKKTCIDKLKKENMEKEITDSKDILKEIKDFYHTLYLRDEREVKFDEFLCNTPLLKISEASRELCDEKITIGECMSVLNEMPLNKSPGNDGLSVEFYRTFWSVIGNVVIDSFNTSFEKGELSKGAFMLNF